MRTSGNEVFEKEMSQCGSMKTIHKAAEMRKEFKDDLLGSVEPVKDLLNQTFQRLQLKEKNITCLSSATDQEISEIWEALKTIDNECDDPNTLKTKSAISEKLLLKEFILIAVERDITFLKSRNVAVPIVIFAGQRNLILKFFNKFTIFQTHFQQTMAVTNHLILFMEKIHLNNTAHL